MLRPRHKDTVCVVAVFKNEAHAIYEWIDHHREEGVSHFFLIDNGSTDDSVRRLQKYGEQLVTLVRDPTVFAQENLYNRHFLTHVGAYDWVIALDLDEFLFARKGKTLREVLTSANDEVSEVQVRWKMFGSNGHTEQPPGILEFFTERCDFARQKHIMDNVKSFARTLRVARIGVHEHKLIHGKRIVLPRVRTEKQLENAVLHLNHYRVQSKNWFFNVKRPRGDVASKRYDAIRCSEHYFDDNDYRGVHDEELGRIVRQRCAETFARKLYDDVSSIDDTQI